MRKIQLIKTESDYENALERLDELFHSSPNSKEGEEAEILAILINEYESIHYEIPSPDPIEAIKIRMEEMDLRQKDLIVEIGSKSVVSEVLNRRRKLTVRMIRNLSSRLKLGAELLVQDYKLKV